MANKPKKEALKAVCDISTKVWLTQEEAFVYLGWGTPKEFQELRDRGQIAFYQRKPGGKCLYRRVELDRYMETFRQHAFAG